MPWNLIRHTVIASTRQLPIASSRNISAPWRLMQLWDRLCVGFLEKHPTHRAQQDITFAQERGAIDAFAMLGCAGCPAGSVWCREPASCGFWVPCTPGPCFKGFKHIPSEERLSSRRVGLMVGDYRNGRDLDIRRTAAAGTTDSTATWCSANGVQPINLGLTR